MCRHRPRHRGCGVEPRATVQGPTRLRDLEGRHRQPRCVRTLAGGGGTPHHFASSIFVFFLVRDRLFRSTDPGAWHTRHRHWDVEWVEGRSADDGMSPKALASLGSRSPRTVSHGRQPALRVLRCAPVLRMTAATDRARSPCGPAGKAGPLGGRDRSVRVPECGRWPQVGVGTECREEAGTLGAACVRKQRGQAAVARCCGMAVRLRLRQEVVWLERGTASRTASGFGVTASRFMTRSDPFGCAKQAISTVVSGKWVLPKTDYESVPRASSTPRRPDLAVDG